MTTIFSLETARIALRQWQPQDFEAFARMNSDAEVMRYFPSLLSREESDALTQKFADLITGNGWGFWVAERREDGAFIGLVGLNRATDLPVASCIEVGWRIDKPFWGNGYATESALAALHFAFSELEQANVAAFTSVTNSRSRAVMHRLGMTDTRQNFIHPRVPRDSELSEHVHYEIAREKFYDSFQSGSVRILTQQ